jgi:hypothetical protein
LLVVVVGRRVVVLVGQRALEVEVLVLQRLLVRLQQLTQAVVVVVVLH